MGMILVTGGCGYIGAHMVHQLVALGQSVIVLDNLWAERPNRLPEEVVFVRGDIRDAEVVDHLFTSHAIEAVIHCASRIQVGESVREPALYYDNNVTGTLTVLDAMVRHGVTRCIFSSSAAVFGEPSYTPIDEAHPIAPLSPYGHSKRMVEVILDDYSRAYGMEVGILRYFNAAGCDHAAGIGELHEPETHLIPLILQVASGRRASIDVFGTDYDTSDGSCIRDYIHVLDLVDAHVRLLAYVQGKPGVHAFNVGTGHGHSVLEILDVAESVTGEAITYAVKPRRAGDPALSVADGSKAQEVLGWSLQYSDSRRVIHDAWEWEKMCAMGDSVQENNALEKYRT